MAAGSKNYLVSIMLTAKDSASAVFQNVGGAAANASGRIEALSKSITPEISRLGTQATIAGGAIVGALGLAGNAAAKYGEQLAQVATLSDEAVGMMDEYRSGLLRLSSMYAQSTDALTRGMYDALSAGITAADALGFMEVASKTAVGGLTDVSTAVDLFTSTLNAWGESASEASHYADVMFATVQIGKTTIPELANSIGMVASTAAMAGVSIEDVGAAIATMTLRGIDTARAVTSLTATITSFMKPTKEMQTALQKAGYASGEALLRAKGLTGAIQWLGEATGGSAEKMATFLGSVEAMRGASAMAANGASDLVNNLQFISDSAGAADTAFSKMSETTAFQMKRAAESTKGAMIEIGTAVAAVMQPIASLVSSIMGWIVTHQWLAKVIAWGGALLGGFSLAVGGVIKVIELGKIANKAYIATKEWLVGAVGKAVAAANGESVALAATTAATEGATTAAAANSVAVEGMATTTVAASATMTTALLTVLGLLAAIAFAIITIRFAWIETKKYIQEAKEAKASIAMREESERKRAFQEEYIATHGTEKGWWEEWKASEESRQLSEGSLAAERKALSGRPSGASGDMFSAIQEAQKQAEQAQKDLAKMAQSQSSQLGLTGSTARPSATGEKTAAAVMAQLPPGTIIEVGGPLLKGIYDRIVEGVLNVAIASTEAVAAMPAEGTVAPSQAWIGAGAPAEWMPSQTPAMQWAPLQLNIALDEGVMVTNWNTAARRRDWDLKVRAAY